MDSADLQLAADLGREVLWMAVKLSFPVLAAALVVGALISVLQAATQVQDQTLNQVPKMLAIAGVIFALMPWFLAVLGEYTETLVTEMGTWFR
jgi:flagellar biosynthesis protein FliQ